MKTSFSYYILAHINSYQYIYLYIYYKSLHDKMMVDLVTCLCRCRSTDLVGGGGGGAIPLFNLSQKSSNPNLRWILPPILSLNYINPNRWSILPLCCLNIVASLPGSPSVSTLLSFLASLCPLSLSESKGLASFELQSLFLWFLKLFQAKNPEVLTKMRWKDA